MILDRFNWKIPPPCNLPASHTCRLLKIKGILHSEKLEPWEWLRIVWGFYIPSLENNKAKKKRKKEEERLGLFSKISTKLLNCLKEFRLCFQKLPFWASFCDLCTKFTLFWRWGRMQYFHITQFRLLNDLRSTDSGEIWSLFFKQKLFDASAIWILGY